MDIGSASGSLIYLLVIIPGFLFVWTYRHFTEPARELGEFEYAAWSYIWGVILLLLTLISATLSSSHLSTTPINNLADLVASAVGVALAQATAGALPLAYIFAIFSKTNLFSGIDRALKRAANAAARFLSWS